MHLAFASAALLLGACVQLRPSAPQPERPPPATPAETPRPQVVAPVVADPMVVVRGDQPLPIAHGPAEQIDCRSGADDVHARIALQAHGGQVTSIAYYSRWRFQTCSIDLDQRDQKIRWRRTEDGATRVQTPHGSFVIRADADTYSVEFHNVQRMKFCGMYGRMSGVMTVTRNTDPPHCTATGILDY